ncbi:MAG: hypothetical protein RIG62_16410 [Cyclobacteriaceae bacterium]
MNKTEIQSWLSNTEFDGSLLLQFCIDENRDKVVLVTLHSVELSKEYQYKFKRTQFGRVVDIKRSWGASIHQESPNHYQASQHTATIEIEQIKLKSYHSKYWIKLDFGHNFGVCEFQFQQLETDQKKGQVIKRKQEERIVDIKSNKIIAFEKPF